ncbi:YHS domain-containing (seleno)protein [Tateyamaria sp. syn59]|uniref:YHS domain-containing (seleno)protein n=1 Tax=Tateyamaria sp. syn59 TaxID=2576942 RepID=UPI0011BFD5FF|nr:YHS domain-containing (seleno)protein [Tateyamaria sp. syn59]
MTFLKKVGPAALFATVFAASGAFAADEVFISDADKGIAINGYDPVAYHTDGKPVKGSADWKYEHEGAVYKFSSEANKKAFKAEPAKFAPAFGGWCTVGTSKGKKIATQPELFAIVDGTLYLNSSDGAHNLFKKDKPGTIDTAESKWTKIESTPAAEL